MQRISTRFVALAYLALTAALAAAQTATAFEVASIKPAAPLDMAAIRAALANGEVPRLGARVDLGRAEYIYVSLQSLIATAYGVKANQIIGPDWLGSQQFDVIAKMPEGATKDDAPKMLQALLADRFKLTLHRENKELPALALLVAEGGPKLKASDAPKAIDPNAPLGPGEKQLNTSDGPARVTTGKNGETINMGAQGVMSYVRDPANGTTKIEVSHTTMRSVAELLTSLLRITGGSLDVKDMTGLTGNYEVAITVPMEALEIAGRTGASSGAAGVAMPADAASDPGSGQSLLLKAVQSMGLKLERRKITVEQLVIDHAEKTPTEN